MKKIFKKINSIIILVVLVICSCTTMVYGAHKETLKGFLYENTDRIYDGSDLFKNNTATSFLVAFNEMMNWIKNDVDYQAIANDNTEDDIRKARNSIDNVTTEVTAMINSGEFFDGVIEGKFKEITGYEANQMGDYYRYLMAHQHKELTAALHYKIGVSNATPGVGVNICDSYVTKFMYTKDQINKYNTAYGFDRLNLSSSEQKETIQKVWSYKLKASDNSKLATRTDIYVAKDDSFETMMSYNKEKIDLYQNLWGKYPTPGGSRENGPIDGVMLEWLHVQEDGNHSAFYYKHFNGKSFVTPISNGSKQYYDIDDLKKNRNKMTNSQINKLEAAELTNNEGFINDTNLGEIEELDASINRKDGIYNIPNRTSTTGGKKLDDVIEGADDFLTVGKDGQLKIEGLQDFSSSLYNILLTVGIIVAVIIGLIIGIKFMLGSVEAKAEVKKLLVPYIVGCIVVFGAFGIWKIVVVILGQL